MVIEPQWIVDVMARVVNVKDSPIVVSLKLLTNIYRSSTLMMISSMTIEMSIYFPVLEALLSQKRQQQSRHERGRMNNHGRSAPLPMYVCHRIKEASTAQE